MTSLDPKIKVLIMEPRPVELSSMIDFLNSSDYDVSTAFDHDSILGKLKHDKPDVFLLSLHTKDELHFIETVRRRFNDTNLPILVLCKSENEELALSSIDLGGDDYILKPFHIKNLNNKITHLFNFKKTNEELQKENGIIESTFLDLVNKINENEELKSQISQLNESVSQSKKLQTMGLFTSKIVHDLNSTLSVILGYSSLLQGRTEDEYFLKKLKSIETSAERGALLVSQIMGYLRKDSGERKKILVNDIISEVCNTNLTHKLSGRISLKCDLQPDLWSISAVPTELFQIIQNLGANAIDAIPNQGEVRITSKNKIIGYKETQMFPHLSPGNYVHISISDTGTGIPPNLMSKIFDPFFSTKKEKGTGLGLSSVRDTMESYKGMITCESKEKKGTVFQIYFPAIDNQEATKPENTTVHDFSPANTEKKSAFLIVDDDLEALSLLKEIFSHSNHEIYMASCADDALDLLSRYQNSIELVILDIMMPDVNGYELFQMMKNIKPSIRCLFNSGILHSPQIEKLVHDGNASFIQKPYNFKSILNMADSLLSKEIMH